MQCSDVWCNAVKCGHVVLCSAGVVVWCCAVQCRVVLCGVVLCWVVLCGTVLCGTVGCSAG